MTEAVLAERRVALAGDFPAAAFADLFEVCFGAPFNSVWWTWKYRAPRNPSRVLIEGGRLMAHYGGMPRPLLMFGETVPGVQVGDVMVHPSARGLGRRGAFFAVASDFLSHELGYGKPHLLAYGFPNLRAMRVAEMLRLYEQVGRIDELRWPARASATPDMQRLLPGAAEEVLARAWGAMRADLGSWVAGVRDYGWWAGRYAQHPLFDYATWHIASAEGEAVIVVREHTDALEWMDFIGPLALLPAARDALRSLAAAAQLPEAIAWCSAGLAQRVVDAETRLVDIQVAVPTGIWSPGPPPQELRDRWLLLGGDADYR